MTRLDPQSTVVVVVVLLARIYHNKIITAPCVISVYLLLLRVLVFFNHNARRFRGLAITTVGFRNGLVIVVYVCRRRMITRLLYNLSSAAIQVAGNMIFILFFPSPWTHLKTLVKTRERSVSRVYYIGTMFVFRRAHNLYTLYTRIITIYVCYTR